MAIETANDHPLKVSVVKETEMYANDHPYKVAIVGGSAGGEARIVDKLPEEGETGYIYLVEKEEAEEGNVYDEWMWVLQKDGETYDWEHIGVTDKVEIILYDSTGTNTDGAMTQLATTSMVYADPAVRNRVQIGSGANVTGSSAIGVGYSSIGANMASGSNAIAIGHDPRAMAWNAIAIGFGSSVFQNESIAIGSSASTQYLYGSVALGAYSQPTRSGEVNVGSVSNTSYGYGNTAYRVIGGVHDGILDHDAATVAQVNEAKTEQFTNAEFNEIFGTSLEEES